MRNSLYVTICIVKSVIQKMTLLDFTQNTFFHSNALLFSVFLCKHLLDGSVTVVLAPQDLAFFPHSISCDLRFCFKQALRSTTTSLMPSIYQQKVLLQVFTSSCQYSYNLCTHKSPFIRTQVLQTLCPDVPHSEVIYTGLKASRDSIMIYSDPMASSHVKHLKDRAKEGILFNNVIITTKHIANRSQPKGTLQLSDQKFLN